MTVGGDTLWVDITMENLDPIAGIQFDLSYPTELVYADTVIVGDRFQDHTLSIESIGSDLRVMIYSSSVQSVTGDSGTLISLGFAAAPVLGDFPMEFIDPVLALLGLPFSGFSPALAYNFGIFCTIWATSIASIPCVYRCLPTMVLFAFPINPRS